MENLVTAHPPTFSYGVLGCSMYQNSSSIICCIANNDNNFTDYGIVENSLVFIQKKLPFKEGALNVFKTNNSVDTSFKLSKEMMDDGIMGEELLPSPDDGIDKLVLRNLQHEVLHKALLSLEKDELEIVNKMFYISSPMSERELAASLGIAKSTLHDRKIAVFKKIKDFFEKN